MLSAPMEVHATEKSESSYDLNYQKLFFEDPLELVSIYDMIAVSYTHLRAHETV